MSLPRHLRDPHHITTIFGRLLKTLFVSEYWYTQRITRFLGDDSLYKLMFYLLAYLLTQTLRYTAL